MLLCYLVNSCISATGVSTGLTWTKINKKNHPNFETLWFGKSVSETCPGEMFLTIVYASNLIRFWVQFGLFQHILPKQLAKRFRLVLICFIENLNSYQTCPDFKNSRNFVNSDQPRSESREAGTWTWWRQGTAVGSDWRSDAKSKQETCTPAYRRHAVQYFLPCK